MRAEDFSSRERRGYFLTVGSGVRFGGEKVASRILMRISDSNGEKLWLDTFTEVAVEFYGRSGIS